MRIATWNLNRPTRGGWRTEALRSFIEQVAADVWILTETHVSFVPGPEYRLAATSATAPDRDPGEVWTAIWTRLPYAEPSPTSDAERTACAEIRPPNGDPLIVFGTVLPWGSDRRREPLRGAAAFCAALQQQATDWARLRAASPEAMLCVAGDFNQDLARGHYYGSRIGRAALERALAEAGLDCWTGGERDPAPGNGGHACIDHICVDVRLTCRAPARFWPAVERLGPRLTDHLGAAVDLGGAAAGVPR